MDFKFYWYISSTWKDGVLRPRCSMLNVDEALNIVNFLIMAFVIFLMVKFINKLRKTDAETTEEVAEDVPTKEEILLSEIRDILKTK